MPASCPFCALPRERVSWESAASALKTRLDASLDPLPRGYNLGINAGLAAGQTVMHAHIHVIPRYAGDMQDPRGGVCGVIPGKQGY